MPQANERKKVLIIDDDRELNQLLTRYLAKFDFEVVSATNGKDGLALLTTEAPVLVVLDVMLPGQSGFEICKQIRANAILPIIMLTARGDLSDRVVGLEMGADDYMPKPFEPRELVARIQSVLRRTEDYPRRNKQRQLYRSAELEVDVAKGAATLDGEALELTVTEFDILSLLIRNPGQTLSRDQIVAQLRGHEWNSVDRSVDVLISRLRHKLKDDPKAPRYLKTMWGTGYRFIGEVSPED